MICFQQWGELWLLQNWDGGPGAVSLVPSNPPDKT